MTVTHSDLYDYFAAGIKKPGTGRIGLEHEKCLFDLKTLKRIDYETGIRPLLESFTATGWNGIFEGPYLIGAKKNGASITLEPGGQLELSGAPYGDVDGVAGELDAYLTLLGPRLKAAGIVGSSLGYDPLTILSDRPWMPKGRYTIMANYMPKVGNLGLEMMTGTATVQVNLDYYSESDMARKMQLSMGLGPLVTAIFAASPFSGGIPSGFQSYRAHIWHHTDPARCGFLPFVFRPDFGFETYVNYALSIPMYFVRRNGQYIDASGLSFRDFMAGDLSILPGHTPTIDDWSDHLSTAFPDVRLRQYIEMRTADGAGRDGMLALAAFWMGLLYDETTLDRALGILDTRYDVDVLQAFHGMVPKDGLKTQASGVSLHDMGRIFLSLARDGLKNRGRGEEKYLFYIDDILTSGITRSHRILDSFLKNPPFNAADFFAVDSL